MLRHVKIYLDENGYTTADVILCEIKAEGCEHIAVDICHIDHRGMGGDKTKDRNDNLLAGCRNCHTLIDQTDWHIYDKGKLRQIAKERIERNASISNRPR